MKSLGMKLIVLQFILVFFVSCGGGGGGGGVPANPGNNEGTPGSPVNLGVITTSTSHAGLIGIMGTSYYMFTASSISGSYTIGLTNTQSDISWALYDSTYASIDSCDSLYVAGDEVCSTPVLSANATYYLAVDEWDGIAGTFTLTVAPL